MGAFDVAGCRDDERSDPPPQTAGKQDVASGKETSMKESNQMPSTSNSPAASNSCGQSLDQIAEKIVDEMIDTSDEGYNNMRLELVTAYADHKLSGKANRLVARMVVTRTDWADAYQQVIIQRAREAKDDE